MPIIEVTDLQKQYPLPENKSEKFYAVNGVSLAIAQGEIFGILGPNGAGKTTTLEMLEGLNDIDGGSQQSTASVSTRIPTKLNRLSVFSCRPTNTLTI